MSRSLLHLPPNADQKLLCVPLRSSSRVREVALEFLGFTTGLVGDSPPLLGWIRLDVELNKDFSNISGTVSFGTPRLICVFFGITRLICVSFRITRLICASFEITRMIYVSFRITRLICASFGITRLICASFGITRLICKGMARGKKDA
ncbi:hypothetical protein E6C27_scaffold403G00230 [Cucumis melo var. makuwa]|uniref:Uncharacterized protein n=1 Tax=Cucumis melo var. makuwa TaxID=1194695 RepID=A0A5A7T2B3_CUCMM|nr:hypothetical protein E6C27_scaffold403G00230 [Cucumis melo var. makuwa]